MALRRSGCDSPWLHHFEGHNVSGLSRPPTSRPIPILLLGGRQQSAPFGSANRAPKAARDRLPQAARRASAREAREANTRGSTFSPALPSAACPLRLLGGARPFQFRQSVGSDARRWYRRESGATPAGGSFLPCSST